MMPFRFALKNIRRQHVYPKHITNSRKRSSERIRDIKLSFCTVRATDTLTISSETRGWKCIVDSKCRLTEY